MKTTAASPQAGMKQQEFERLFSEHGAMVYRAAYSVTGNKHEAQDVQQDVFLKLIDDGRTLEFTANPAGYLYRMAINKALENYRKRERRNETDDGLEPLEDLPSEVNPRENDMRERLLQGIAQLDRAMRKSCCYRSNRVIPTSKSAKWWAKAPAPSM